MQTMQAIKVKQIRTTLPASDIERAKRWYEQTFGWRPTTEREDGLTYDIDGNGLFLYPSSMAGTNKATAATFVVDDAPRMADHLRQNGVQLEQYDLPHVRWENGLARMTTDGEEIVGGWFQDSEGNIIGFGEYPTR